MIREHTKSSEYFLVMEQKSLENKLIAIEHDTLKRLRSSGLENSHFVLAVSGGVDSMALLCIFHRLKALLPGGVSVVHIHHGSSSNLQYRNKAWQLVKKTTGLLELDFYSNVFDLKKLPEINLKNEAELREFRHNEISKLVQTMDHKNICVCFGHHQDDLLETRLLRLIRGVGPQGLKSMTDFDQNFCRPLLSYSKAELGVYLNENNMMSLEDPSNSETDPLRNWLRKEWLPQLENRQPGALAVMANSLELLSELGQDQSQKLMQYVSVRGLELSLLLSLSESQKRQLLALYMRQNQLKNYTSNHIDEILKRLDLPQKRHTFSLIKRNWSIENGWLRVELQEV